MSTESSPNLTRHGVTYAKLGVNQRNALLQQFKEKARQDLDRDLKESGLPPEQVYAEKTVFVSSRWGYGRFCQMLDELDGQVAVLKTSLKKAHPGKTDEEIENLLTANVDAFEDVVKFCCELTGVPWSPPQKVPANMKQVGVMDGKPIFVAEDGKIPESKDGDEENPTPAPMRGYAAS